MGNCIPSYKYYSVEFYHNHQLCKFFFHTSKEKQIFSHMRLTWSSFKHYNKCNKNDAHGKYQLEYLVYTYSRFLEKYIWTNVLFVTPEIFSILAPIIIYDKKYKKHTKVPKSIHGKFHFTWKQ
jgi:hypothetical protein